MLLAETDDSGLAVDTWLPRRLATETAGYREGWLQRRLATEKAGDTDCWLRASGDGENRRQRAGDVEGL